MLEIINHLDNPDAEARATKLIASAYDELRTILPELPQELRIYFDNDNLIPELGVGGFAYAPGILTFSYDADFADKTLQNRELRSTVFHEGYHLVQGHTFEDAHAPYRHGLDSAIYEGCATIFERMFAATEPPYGKYDDRTSEELQGWANALAAIPIDAFVANDGELWQRWAFYDRESGERWRFYKVGTWIVDRVLAVSDWDILDLRSKSAKEIMELLPS